MHVHAESLETGISSSSSIHPEYRTTFNVPSKVAISKLTIESVQIHALMSDINDNACMEVTDHYMSLLHTFAYLHVRNSLTYLLTYLQVTEVLA